VNDKYVTQIATRCLSAVWQNPIHPHAIAEALEIDAGLLFI
jgi:hypothetical protein